jgi:hypothetical protein
MIKIEKRKAKLFLCLIKYHAMKTYEAVEVQLHAFLNDARWTASRPGIFTPGEREPDAHWIGGPTGGLDAVAKRREMPASPGNRTPSSS